MKDIIKKNKFNIIVFLLYASITLTIALLHESWRDEAQSWLIARDLNVFEIIGQMRYEGHPCLWYLILHPFAKLGFPYITVKLISWIIMNITAILILTKAPFDKYIKVLILLTTPFIYLYPAISRSYCLIALAIVFIAITYKTRKKSPIRYTLSLMLLAYTHVIMSALVGILYLDFFYEEIIRKFKEKTKNEKRQILISLLIAIFGIVLLFLQLLNSFSTNANINSRIVINFQTVSLVLRVIEKTLGILFGTKYTYLVSVLIIALLVNQFMENKKYTIIMCISIIYQVMIYTLIYSVSEQRAATMILIVLLFAWIQKEQEIDNKKKKMKITELLICILLILNMGQSITICAKDIKYKYSASKQTAEYINNLEEDAIIIASHVPISSAIIPYTNIEEFWSPQINDFFSYTIWDEKNEIQNQVPIETVIHNINNKFNNQNNVYFIYCYNWKYKDLNYFIQETRAKQIFKSETDIIKYDEKYIVYKLYCE